MTDLRYTLVSDGSSDRALIPILNWLLRENGVQHAIQPSWADLARIPNPPRELSEKISWAVEIYPCDLLFIHRDAETGDRQARLREIGEAVERVLAGFTIPHRVCVIPVRMTEAWLLFSEAAIRRAAGNVSGRYILRLPAVNNIENTNDPKRILYDLLKIASGLTGRRLKRFLVSYHACRISGFIEDFSPLRALPAFRCLEEDLIAIIQEMTWAQ
jgi:hypothetical protein